MPSEREFGFLAIAFACACSGPKLEVLERGPPSFLKRDDATLVDGGQPYRFVSYNAFTLTGCGPNPPTEAETAAFFASLRPRSMVRTYAFEPIGLEGVERVVAAARDHGHLLTLVLTDHASSCGEQEVEKPPEFYESGFRDAYLPWVRRVVTRFADEPAVGMWEPVKAARAEAQTLRTFYDAVGGEIHGLDRNHLVHAGTHGPWAYGGDAGYALIGESAGIDVLSFHDYGNDPVPPLNLEASVRAAAPLKKPVVLAELGLYAGLVASSSPGPDNEVCVDWEERRDAARIKLDASFKESSLAGVLFWNWSQVGGVGCSYTISENDPTYELIRTYPIP